MSRRSRSKAPKRGIPGAGQLWCFGCSAPSARGRIDAHGGLFLACEGCRLMSFGWSSAAIWSWKAISETILASAEFRAQIRQRAAELAELALAQHFQSLPTAAPAPAAPAPAEAAGP